MRIHTRRATAVAAAAAFASAGTLVSTRARAATFHEFSFATNYSTSGPYDPTRDVRLDSVGVGGATLSALQAVNGATILVDDGRDATRGGGNFAAGRGPNTVSDAWAAEGPATVTPTSGDLRAALGNFNLTSLAITRENVGTAVLDVTFPTPTNTFFFWERGSATVAGNSDLLVEALDDADKVVAAYKILRGHYTDTGLVVSTDVGAFTVSNVKLGSIGLQLEGDALASKLRLISTQASNFEDAGPDYKVLAAVGTVAPVPEPGAAMGLASGLGVLALRRRRRRSGATGI